MKIMHHKTAIKNVSYRPISICQSWTNNYFFSSKIRRFSSGTFYVSWKYDNGGDQFIFSRLKGNSVKGSYSRK